MLSAARVEGLGGGREESMDGGKYRESPNTYRAVRSQKSDGTWPSIVMTPV